MSRTSKEEIRYAIFTEVESREFGGMFQKLQEDSETLDRFSDVTDFIRFMHDDGDDDWDMKNNALFALIVAARSVHNYGTAAQTLLIAALWPGLDRVSKQVEPAPASIQDSFAEVYYAALHEIRSWNLSRQGKIAANLLLAVKKRVIRLYKATRKREMLPLSVPDDYEDDIDSESFLSGTDEIQNGKTVEMLAEDRNGADLLVPLVAKNVISPQESLLIVLRIFHDRDLIEIAESSGVSYKTLCRQYERAIQRLKDFFEDEKGFWRYLEGKE